MSVHARVATEVVPSPHEASPEFERWFTGSKVVDEQGRPRVVYHGTSRIFSRFNEERTGDNFLAARGAFFFAEELAVAEQMADHAAETDESDEAGAATIMPVYLALKSPLVRDFRGRRINVASIINEAKAAGHDGVIALKARDSMPAWPATQYIAFRPEQIKSAVGNGAQFDDFRCSREQNSTSDFERWFRASVVTECGQPGGKPLVVYHGTTEDVQGAFDLKRTGLRTGNRYGQGAVFFTSNPVAASAYAATPYRETHPDDKPNVIAAYLSLQNPLVIDAEEGLGPRDGYRSWMHFKDRIAQAQSDGYDGAIVRNVLDHASAVTAVQEGPVDVYVAFAPEQIKSAIGNRGTFDGRNPDIRYRLQPAGELAVSRRERQR